MDKGDRKLHASKAHKEEESFLNRRKELFRRLPKIDRLMGRELTKELTEQYGYRAVLEAARKVEEQLRMPCVSRFWWKKSQLCSWIHPDYQDRRMAYR